MNDRDLLPASYSAAQIGVTRHMTDVTYTRNWLVTGLTVYYGAIIAAGKYEPWVNMPALLVVLLALLFTAYERGNAQLLKDYCLRLERGEIPLPLETWLQLQEKRKFREKVGYYATVSWRKKIYWVWMVLLVATVLLVALLVKRT